MAQARKYWNQSERYGGREQATIDDYRVLNPDGDFVETTRDRQWVIIDRNRNEVVATQRRDG